METDLNSLFSYYKKTDSTIEFQTSSSTELFLTKKEQITSIFIIIPIITLILPIIWIMCSNYGFYQNITIISIIFIIGIIIECKLISSLNLNINEVKMTFSPEALIIDSYKRGVIYIESYNIANIYIKSEEYRSSYNSKYSQSTYTIVCKLHKSIKLPINNNNIEEITLLKNFEGKNNLNKAREVISDLKHILNLKEDINNNQEKYFDIGDTKFEKYPKKIIITTKSIDGFFNGYYYNDFVDISFAVIFSGSVLATFGISAITPIDYKLLTISIVIALVSLISFIIFKLKTIPSKIIYTITPYEIKIDTDKKQSFLVNKNDVKSVNLEKVKDIKDRGLSTAFYVIYDNILIKLNKKISFYPIRFLISDEINLFGNIKTENNEYSKIIAEEIAKMLQL